MADKSRTEAEQLNKSPKEDSGEESSEERNEQELPQNENSETTKIHDNEISSNKAKEVGVSNFNNNWRAGCTDGPEARGGRNYEIKGNKIHSNKGQRVGIRNFGNNYSTSNVSFFLAGLMVLVFAIYYYIYSEASGTNKKKI